MRSPTHVFQAVMSRAGVAGDDVAFLDLCCGKSLNSTLLTLLYPNAQVVAIDMINPACAPHFSGQAEYMEANIFEPGFVADVAAKVGNRPVVVVGMHLCGKLVRWWPEGGLRVVRGPAGWLVSVR